MADKYRITIDILDINNKFTINSLAETVRSKWLPPSHDMQLLDLKVGVISTMDMRMPVED